MNRFNSRLDTTEKRNRRLKSRFTKNLLKQRGKNEREKGMEECKVYRIESNNLKHTQVESQEDRREKNDKIWMWGNNGQGFCDLSNPRRVCCIIIYHINRIKEEKNMNKCQENIWWNPIPIPDFKNPLAN